MKDECVTKTGDGRWRMEIPVGDWNYAITIEVVQAGIRIDYTLFPWKELDIARHRVRGKGKT